MPHIRLFSALISGASLLLLAPHAAASDRIANPDNSTNLVKPKSADTDRESIRRPGDDGVTSIQQWRYTYCDPENLVDETRDARIATHIGSGDVVYEGFWMGEWTELASEELYYERWCNE